MSLSTYMYNGALAGLLNFSLIQSMMSFTAVDTNIAFKYEMMTGVYRFLITIIIYIIIYIYYI